MGTTIIPKEVTSLEIKGIERNGGVSTVVEDADQGIVTAFVSITGVKDKVNDIIMPGAYSDTLTKRSPKGILDHDWKSVVSKPLELKELMPGDPDLPDSFADGTPWPVGAGALRVKAQYNLGSTAGRDAFSNAQFWGDDQEWSIGYTVPAGQFTKSNGVRHIKSLDLFEYSMVLWGAMPHARTIAVKDMLAGGIKALVEGEDADTEDTDADAAAAFQQATKTYMESIEDAFAAGVLDRKSFRSLYAPLATKSWTEMDEHDDTDDEDDDKPKGKGKGKRAFPGAAPPFGKKSAVAVDTPVTDPELEAIVAESEFDDDAKTELRKAVQEMVDADTAEGRADAEETVVNALVIAGEASDEAKSVMAAVAADLMEAFQTKGWTVSDDDKTDVETKGDIITIDAADFDIDALLSATD